MQAPRKIRPKDLADYLEVMTRAIFQAGISWRVIDAKWEGFRRAFHGFDPAYVAALTERDIDQLAADPQIVRNRAKIAATAENAATMLRLEADFGGFRRYLRAHGDFEATAAELRRRYRFLGDTGAYYFLYLVGERVPHHDAWARSRGILIREPAGARSR